MNPDRWTRVKELLSETLELQPEQRAAFLTRQCGADNDLKAEVESLLDCYDEADEFMESSQRVTAAAVASAAGLDPYTDARIGPYRVVEEIGRGGMGTVYRAVRADDAFRKQVAIKIVRRGMDHDFILRRFRNERQILATLDHPNIARLIDGGTTEDGLPYFVMEYVDGGKPIHQYCDEKRMNTRERLVLFRQVCSAVQSAHERRIVHRDIKPGNILVTPRGAPKLLDFGIAKILDPEFSSQTLDPTATVLRLMTPEYASPEQVRGEEITAASDVYSLGVLLYELLTGHRPYRLRSRSPHEIALVICEEAPERPSTMVNRTELVTRTEGPVTVTPDFVSKARNTRPDDLRKALCGDLDNIVLMAMRKEPERRYATASELDEDIDRYLQGMPVKARNDAFTYRFSRAIRRNRTTVAVAAAALLFGTLAVVAWRDLLAPNLFQTPAASTIVPLTSYPGDETQPAFSPDGKRLAFVWEGESAGHSDIYIKPVRGAGMERLTTNPAEDVSPTWSPDGKRIAWLRANETETAVYMAPAQAGAVHGRVTTLYPNRTDAVGRHLDWSPDGKYLAAADKRSPDEPFAIVLIEVSTGHKIQFSNPPPGSVGDSNPVYSPDGSSIAFIRGVSSGVDDIFVKKIGAADANRITEDRRFVISIGWSPNGRSILFSSNRAGAHSLWRVPSSGGTPERVASVADNASDPVFSRDGKLIAFSQFYLDTNVWRLNLATAERTKVIPSTQYDSSPKYSPDGTRMAFRSSRSGTSEIWIAQANGAGPRQVTHMSNSLTGSPDWSPDGKRLVFDSRPDGQPDIFTVKLDGSDQRRLTTEPREYVVPSRSRDG
ncbi:MAG TPA: protein kinase, partial [Bryobacteraceae bacterium]|nr:protein kinase [Bryobacteraceae bacterium]